MCLGLGELSFELSELSGSGSLHVTTMFICCVSCPVVAIWPFFQAWSIRVLQLQRASVRACFPLAFAELECVEQVLTKGKGPIGQLGLPLGLPLNPELAGFGLAVWVGFFLVAGVTLALACCLSSKILCQSLSAYTTCGVCPALDAEPYLYA